jgi:asparagine synthase (glutamine-hydrolysing)
MSGICGISEPGRNLSHRLLSPMLEALSISGAHETGVIGDRSCVLGVARRWNFQQAGRLQRVEVALDADLVDLAAVAAALSETDSAIRSMPLPEVVARLYLRYDADFPKFLSGGFSIALWDEKEQKLLLAIDQMGIKSLCWRREGNRILFASRLGAIRAVQGDPTEANPAAILQFLLFSAIPAPLSSDRGTHKLRPGTTVTIVSDRVIERQYWDLEYPENERRSVSDWAADLREHMRSAVHRNLEGCDQPTTGCYLSGGTDSSSVVAFASEKHHPTQTFSIAFEEAGYSEIEFARTTAAAFKTSHHERFLTPKDASEALDNIISFYDEPFANSSAIGSYYCAVLARENGVSTLLAGDGGDELFAGNERYARDKYFALYHQMPRWLRHELIEPLVRLLPAEDGKLSLPRKYVRRANIPNPRRMLSYGFFLSRPPQEVFEDGFLGQVGTEDWLAIPEAHFAGAKASSDLNRILHLDVKMTLADNDIRKVSGTADLAGVNVRYPLLDRRLAEFSGRVPAKLKLKGFEKRYIFKQAMKEILPKKVLYKKKHGFGVPLAQWLLQDPRMRDLMQDMMHDSRTRQRGYFRDGFFEKLVNLHRQQPNYFGEIVWYLLALELWHRKHLDWKRETVDAT